MIFVVDVSNVFKKCRTSSVFLLFAASLLLSNVTADYTVNPWAWHSPIGSLQGTYQYVASKMNDHPPTLASLWELGDSDFDIVVWPPKYCAAVHVFFIDSKYKGVGKFHVLPEMAQGPSVKYNMPTGEIELNPTGKAPKSYFNQRSSIPFQSTSSFKYSVSVTDTFVDKIKGYNDATTGGSNVKKVDFDLTGKMALILTNSRFCFAHITKDGGNGEFIQLHDVDRMNTTNTKAKIFTTYDKPNGIDSLFDPIEHIVHPLPQGQKVTTAKYPKTVDLLPMLQSPQFHDITKIRAPHQCSGFVTTSRNRLKKSIDQVSADSWQVIEMQLAPDQARDDHFIVAVGRECSWIRLWITKDAQLTDFNAQKHLGETIDIFFDQQFFVGPDSNEARPLSGNSNQIDRISIRRHWNQVDQNSKSGLVQMSYGRDGGRSLPYIEYFFMPSMSEQDFTVHLIKAPKCQANVVMAPETQLASANQPPTNIFKFDSCTKTYWKNKIKDDVADK